jgi:hypothetical protein
MGEQENRSSSMWSFTSAVCGNRGSAGCAMPSRVCCALLVDWVASTRLQRVVHRAVGYLWEWVGWRWVHKDHAGRIKDASLEVQVEGQVEWVTAVGWDGCTYCNDADGFMCGNRTHQLCAREKGAHVSEGEGYVYHCWGSYECDIWAQFNAQCIIAVDIHKISTVPALLELCLTNIAVQGNMLILCISKLCSAQPLVTNQWQWVCMYLQNMSTSLCMQGPGWARRDVSWL